MEARRLLAAAPYGPDTIKALQDAFDEAWGRVAHTVDTANPDALTDARLRMAHAILAANVLHPSDIEVMKAAAIKAFEKPIAPTSSQRV